MLKKILKNATLVLMLLLTFSTNISSANNSNCKQTNNEITICVNDPGPGIIDPEPRV